MDQQCLTRRAARAAAAPSRALGACLALLVAAACTERITAPSRPLGAVVAGAPEISVVKDPDLFCPFGCDEIAAGDSMRFFVRTASPTGRERFNEHAKWTISDERIATISPRGVVTGRAPGEVEITAEVGPQKASLKVTIAAARIARVALHAPTTTIDPRGTVQLKATAFDVLGQPVNDAPMFWFSATPDVVSVSDDGMVTGVGPGDGIVMAFAEFGRSAWVSVHVNGTVTAPAFPVASLDVGATQTCSVGASGAASCWGWNYFGQLGYGYFSEGWATFPVPGAVTGRLAFSHVDAGDFHTCGLTTAGAAYCWGLGDNGRLGTGEAFGASPSPVAVATRQAFASIAAGGDHACALDAQGAAWCWGLGVFGQLGTGTLENALVPTRLATTAPFARIFPGLWHSCALGTDGAAWCWGSNDFGQLGNGKISFDVDPTPAPVRTKLRFAQMDSRVSHACGVTATGEAWCWGRNDFGQAGDGTFESKPRPTRVTTSVPFTRIAAGTHHSCALATDGRAYCWGNNDWGQLGDNTLASRATPAPVHGTQRFTSLTAGNNVTCGTTTAGEAWCWGSTHFGMPGNGQDGPDTISPVPVRVIAPRR